MSNLKKTLIGRIITILMILGDSSISNAYTSYNKVGSTYWLEYNRDYVGNSSLYCVQHRQHFYSSGMDYKVETKIKIKGKTSTGLKRRQS